MIRPVLRAKDTEFARQYGISRANSLFEEIAIAKY